MTASQVRAGVVSTVITVYNRPQLLTEAVNSVLAQTYRPIEIIIVDDGSTDESGQVARKFETQFPDIVRYAHQANGGPASASNCGLRLITGEFVQFLDSDDLIMPDKFAMQVAGLRANPEAGIAYCYAREYALGQPWSGFPSRRSGQTFDRLFPALLAGKIWPTPAPLYRRSVVEDNGTFLDVSIYQDWEYEGRAAARGVRLHHVHAYLADLRGVHRQEGRKKGGASGRKLQEVAIVLERILAQARSAMVPVADLETFSGKLFFTARQCAAGGYLEEAQRCIALGQSCCGTVRGAQLRLYAALSDAFGWQRVGQGYDRIERSRATITVKVVCRQPRAIYARWRHRIVEALATTNGQPVARWPSLLWDRWQHRRSRERVHV